jgi:DMSO/TMAO reductase YedYZ molybdopterin-dependent catalytic subunit
MEFEGVAFTTLASLVKSKLTATHVSFKSFDGYSTNNPLDACMDDDVMIAHKWNGSRCPKSTVAPRA